MIKTLLIIAVLFKSIICIAKPIKNNIDTLIVKDSIVYINDKKLTANIKNTLINTTALQINTSTYSISNCYVIDGVLFLPIKAKVKIISNKPDACKNIYTTINGKTCAANGCITGTGSGLCSKIKLQTKKYNITLKIKK